MKSILLFFALTLLLATLSAAAQPQSDQTSRLPNILLITADDLGLQLSCYGDPIAQTPHLDQLAERSVRFETAYVSQASCSPSRSTMLTGLYPHSNGQYGLANENTDFRIHEHLLDDLLPNVLKRAGYRTGIIGKLHVDPLKSFAFDKRYNEGFGSRDVRKQVAQAREFIATEADEPWFLMFNLFDPHAGRKPLPGGGKGPHYFPDEVQGLPEKQLTADDVPPWPFQGIDSPEQRIHIAGYYNCAHRVDAAIGMLMADLKKAGVADDTLIIFLGDHGPPFTRGKTSCYEAGLRVPFLVRWPSVSKAHVSKKLISSADIHPTILDAAGIDIPTNLHGRSLRPVMKPTKKTDWRTTLVGEFHFHNGAPFFPRRAITDGRYKLIHNPLAGKATAGTGIGGDKSWDHAQKLPKSHPLREVMDRLSNPPEWELYDLDNDPNEFKNRAGETDLKKIQSRLKTALATWQKETQDPFTDPKFLEEMHAQYNTKK